MLSSAFERSAARKEFRAEHAEELAQHEAAKKAFDALGGKPIPKVAQLSQEYAALLAKKKEKYAEYKELRQDMLSLQTARQNVDKILGIETEKSRKELQAR